MRETGIVDSSSLGVLVSAHRRIRKAGARLTFCGLSDAMKEMFRLTALDRCFTIVDGPPPTLPGTP
jgi:anti-sigma B factor antagonist